jgi:hypothetical protein
MTMDSHLLVLLLVDGLLVLLLLSQGTGLLLVSLLIGLTVANKKHQTSQVHAAST